MGRNKEVLKHILGGLVLLIGNIEELIALSRHKYFFIVIGKFYKEQQRYTTGNSHFWELSY
jgi:hypothetical protein